MRLTGYVSELSARPGQQLGFMVSSAHEEYEVDFVRLIDGAGDDREYEVALPSTAARYPGAVYGFPRGSYVRAPFEAGKAVGGPVAFTGWFRPTAIGGGGRTLLELRAAAEARVALILNDAGRLECWVGNGRRLDLGSVPTAAWTFAGISLDASRTRLAAFLAAPEEWPRSRAARLEELSLELPLDLGHAASLVFGASLRSDNGYDARSSRHFDGKLDEPAAYRLHFSAPEVEQIATGNRFDPVEIDAPCLARWMVGWPAAGDTVPDALGGPGGRVVNRGMRAVTGRRWQGNVAGPAEDADQYSAIYLRRDDLADARWPIAFNLTVPDWPSGVYAARLRAGEDEDRIPFVIRPAEAANARVLLVLPTFSYLAYANEHRSWKIPNLSEIAGSPIADRVTEADRWMLEQQLLSVYDSHADGSGVAYSSMLRPLLSFRPGYQMPLLGSPHQFSLDLHIVGWLRSIGIEHEVATDHDLHEEGAELLGRYDVVITGSHPEYTSGPLLDAYQGHLTAGGKLMYMGANGFYWVTERPPDAPQGVEVRRGFAGTRAWTAPPGEAVMSGSGEPSGLWRHRGRPPQQLVGIGFTAQGTTGGRPYRRTPESYEPEIAFLFDGIDEDVFGTEGLVMGAAGSHELDRVDAELGTPPGTVVLATTSGFSDVYQAVVEEMRFGDPRQGGTQSPLVHGDCVLVEGATGGRVFATGSIGWTGGMAWNGYRNPVARLTENVLRYFLALGERPER